MQEVNQWQKNRDEEREMDKRIRTIMNDRRITYQEAKVLVEKNQKSLFDF